jgi:Cell division protein FtsI/penicillin-binding protein 2
MFATVIIVGRLFAFQIVQGKAWAERASDKLTLIARPERGIIYDRNGAVLAANGADYQISVAPNLVYEPQELSAALSSILQRPQLEIRALLEQNVPYQLIQGRVSPQVAELVRALPYEGIQIDPLPRRFYPQNELMCHVLGYVDFDGNGGSGLEGYYQQELAGETASIVLNISPLTMQQSLIARDGADLVLTIDRTVQYVVEKHLKQGLAQYGAESGTIIVMNPRTGAILAMANYPAITRMSFTVLISRCC